MPDNSQAIARRRFYDYRIGWLDGADFATVDTSIYSPEYLQGYQDGREALVQALAVARERYGYIPPIMKPIEEK
jgi:hypothetical protein